MAAEYREEYREFDGPRSRSSSFLGPERRPLICNVVTLAALLVLGGAASAMVSNVANVFPVPRGGRRSRLGVRASRLILREHTACDVNIAIVRHCNKRPTWDAHPTPESLCTEAGLLRGQNLARIFGREGRFPQPSRLYARALPENAFANRDLYLLWPLAQLSKVWVNTTFAGDEVLSLAASLLDERPMLCGQTVLISWDHCCIPALAQALGCRDEQCSTCWDDEDYDKFFWLHYHRRNRSSDWQLSFRLEHEEFGQNEGPSGYRECLGNPLEGANFGYECKRVDNGAT